ncbi:unnamed protein product, partial [Cyprideis torosa]
MSSRDFLSTADNFTALHFATYLGHTSSVAFLLEMGAPVEAAVREWNATPLHLACGKGHFHCAQLLLNAEANVNSQDRDGRTPFLMAAAGNHVDILKLLVRSGADISLPDDDNRTALHYASGRGHTSSVACLLELGAPVEAEDKDKWRPLHLACGKIPHFGCIQLLVKAGAEVNAQTAQGITPFLMAAAGNQVEILKLLAHSGADIALPS